MAKTSVLIPDGESTLTMHVVHCLSMDKDIEIHVLSKDPNARIRHSRFIRSFHSYEEKWTGGPAVPPASGKADKVMEELIRFHHYDLGNKDEIIAEMIRVVQKTKAEIVFPVDEHIIKIIAADKDAIRKVALLAPLPDLNTFTMAIDKGRLAEFLKGSDVPHPTTVRYAKGISDKAIQGLPFPVIIKPSGFILFKVRPNCLLFLKARKYTTNTSYNPSLTGTISTAVVYVPKAVFCPTPFNGESSHQRTGLPPPLELNFNTMRKSSPWWKG